MKTWILVADAHHAEIWCRENRHQPEKVDTVMPSEQHRFSREIGSDRPGRAIASSDTRRAAVEPHEDLIEAEHRHFARQLTDRLHDSFARRDFDRLAIIAAPKMLGLLRADLDPALLKVTIAEMPKDLVKVPAAEVRDRILALVP